MALDLRTLSRLVWIAWAFAPALALAQMPAQPAHATARVAEPRLTQEGVEFFEKRIRPVLVASCYKCHSGDPAKAKGGLLLDTHDGLRKGGESGEVVALGNPEKSLLIEALKFEGVEMPPTGKLPDEVITDFETWVTMGAPDPRKARSGGVQSKADLLATAQRFWAFQRPRGSTPPAVQDTSWPSSDIDRFVLARLEKDGLRPVANADRSTLLRRLSFDLTGLPPTPEELDAFLNDQAANAVEKVVDRLLDSPRFGERWGRHWLDVVRYGESSGKERNLPYRYAWRYRDYVIDAFNNDTPFDRFILEQLAGDLIEPKKPEEHDKRLVATGFLALGPQSAATKNPEQFKLDVIDDQIDVTGRAFLGLTIACARCHDHHFDPIPTSDYYALAGMFHSTETYSGIGPGRRTVSQSRLLKLFSADGSSTRSPEEYKREKEIAGLTQQLKLLRNQLTRPAQSMAVLPAVKRNPNQRQSLVKAFKAQQQDIRKQIQTLEDKLDEIEGDSTDPGNLAMGVAEAERPSNVPIQIHGELSEKGPVVPRGVLTVLKTPMNTIIPEHRSGRLQLAYWIADRANPLTARVMVNRVWAHLFGQGLVDTVDNFGTLGSQPSHPELLDTLAVQFMEQKWSVKRLIRTLVLSRTYQLSTVHDEHNYEKDPDNRLLWRMPHRRLDAEEIRDAMLMAGGQLDLQRPEGSVVMQLSNKGVNAGKGMQEVRKPSNVRSVYLPVVRGQVPAMLGVFDMADPNLIVGKRDVTTVPTQALFLMNNPFVLNQAREMARRILRQEGLNPNARIDLAYRLALGRLATPSERDQAASYLADFRKTLEADQTPGNPQLISWSSFCQTLFQSGQFRYVD